MTDRNACTCGGNGTCHACMLADLRSTPRFTVAFDFPEGGDPFFPVYMHDGSPGITPQLQYAARWQTEQDAQRYLDNICGPHTRQFGVVVEVAL